MPFDPADPRLLEHAIEIARSAGAAILPFFKCGTEVRTKDDASPVTAANRAADTPIVSALCEPAPSVAILSGESAGSVGRQVPAGTFWFVDPLDGTREFIGGRDEFTVNIALVSDGQPVLGIVSLPARNELCAGGAADVYPRAGRTMEWDTAAGQALLIAAGGNVFDRNGVPLTYGKPGFENPSFIARGAASHGAS